MWLRSLSVSGNIVRTSPSYHLKEGNKGNLCNIIYNKSDLVVRE